MPDVHGRDFPYDWHRILSGLLVIAWLTLAAFAGGVETVLKQALAVALPVACVWFPDELGSLTTMFPGPVSAMPITQQSPGGLVRALGWVVLVLLTFGQFLVFLAAS